MTDKKHRTASPTDRRPDCVTETRMGPHCFRLFQERHHRHRSRQDDESAGSGNRSRTKAALYCMSRGYEKSGHAGEHDRWNGSDYNAAISSAI